MTPDPTPMKRQEYGGDGGGGRNLGRVHLPSGIMKIHHIKPCLVSRAGKARAQAVLGRAGGGAIDFMTVESIRSWPTTSLETAPVFSLFFFSFVSLANSTPRATSPSGEIQATVGKLGTISPLFLPRN